MSSSYVSAKLRRQVYKRANDCCEYCLMPEQFSLITFSIDHIIAEKHGGQTQLENLALSCPVCNQYKGSDIASIDPETNKLCALYHPRADNWIEHFFFEKAVLQPLSAKGRVTVRILRLNQANRIKERQLLYTAGLLTMPQ